MRSSVTFAVACGAIAFTAFAADSARAANAWGGSYCMSDREGRSDCSFTTLAQCWASASGTDAGCYARPPRAVVQQQGGFGTQGVPTQGRRGARVGGGER
jgi:hypothetical protein